MKFDWYYWIITMDGRLYWSAIAFIIFLMIMFFMTTEAAALHEAWLQLNSVKT
jgi:hypothetical protein